MRSPKFSTARMASMFDVDQLRLQIEAVLRDYPELADDEILRADMLDGATDIEAVLTSLFRSSSRDKSMADAITARIDQMSARRARFKSRVEFARSLMLKVLQSADRKKFELPEATLSQRASQPQIVGEVSGDDLPDDLVRISREPDRVKIREALLARREVPGLTLSNSPPTLAVNTR